jgi:hypothetical protein
MAARQDAQTCQDTQQQQQQQENLLGKAPAGDEHLSHAEKVSMLPTFYKTDTPASNNEQWNRLNEDPLLAIKRQEQQSLQRIKENPIKMQEILKEVSTAFNCAPTYTGYGSVQS